MSNRSIENRSFTPDDIAMLSQAFRRVCAECDLTGPVGRALLARTLMARFQSGLTREDELVNIARIIVWRSRGLRGGLHAVHEAAAGPPEPVS